MLLGAGYTEPAGDLEFGTAGPTPSRKAGLSRVRSRRRKGRDNAGKFMLIHKASPTVPSDTVGHFLISVGTFSLLRVKANSHHESAFDLALRLACDIFRRSAGAFWPKHNLSRMQSNHTRETNRSSP